MFCMGALFFPEVLQFRKKCDIIDRNIKRDSPFVKNDKK